MIPNLSVYLLQYFKLAPPFVLIRLQLVATLFVISVTPYAKHYGLSMHSILTASWLNGVNVRR